MKKTKLIICFTIISCTFLSGCALKGSDNEVMTQLQVREIQTREMDTSDTKLVMKSMMNVLQDEGFIIKNAVLDLGLLSAEKHIDIENTPLAMLMLAFNAHATWEKQQILEASANLSEFGDKTRIRINFQMKTLNNFGQVRNVVTVTDPEYYLRFFEKVSKGVFIQEQGI